MSTPIKFLTKNFGAYDTSSIGAYMNIGGFSALKKAVNMDPEDICTLLSDAKIKGRGGAEYPCVLSGMAEAWGGKVIDIPYTQGISSTAMNQRLKEIGTTPEIRMKRLRRLIGAKKIVRILESHSGLTGLIISIPLSKT